MGLRTHPRTSILISGDAGPVRDTLLGRGELNLWWSDTVEGSVATARQARPQVCLSRAKLRDGGVLDLLARLRATGGPACIVLLTSDEWDLLPRCFAAGAADVVELDRGPAILQAIGDYTGLSFAKEARARFETVVEVELEGEQLVLETVNISASGVGIREFPRAAPGTLVRLSFTMQARTIALWARVVRCVGEGPLTVAGLRFVGTTETQVDWLRDAVERRNAALPRAQIHLETLFDDLKLPNEQPAELQTGDLGPPPARQEISLSVPDPMLYPLRAYYAAPDDAGRARVDLPPWLLRLSSVLTAIERSAALGEPTPEWAERALNARVKLARCRASAAFDPIPAALAEQAYQLFVQLGAEPSVGSDALVVQIGEIRAAILRELVSKQTLGRISASTGMVGGRPGVATVVLAPMGGLNIRPASPRPS